MAAPAKLSPAPVGSTKFFTLNAERCVVSLFEYKEAPWAPFFIITNSKYPI